MQMTEKIEAIVIGASAGGVEALIDILESLPEDFGAAIIVVLHLPPQRATALPQLFARRCALPVKEAEDKETIQPGTVYLAPPDYHLLVEPDRRLALSVDEPQHFSRPAIDLLFESAAYAYREKLIGVVLTGASVDGAAGLCTIQAFGGATWVQDPDEASMGTMPAAAIAQGGADEVLPLREIGSRLSRMTRVEESK